MKWYYILSATIFAFTLFSQVLVYLIADAYCSPHPDWVRRLNEKCGVPPANQSFLNNSLAYSGATASGYGGYLGVLMHKHFYGPNAVDLLHTSFLKFVARFFVMVGLSMPGLLLFVFVPWSAQLAWVTLFKFLLPGFYISLIIFGFANYVFAKCGLVNVKRIVYEADEDEVIKKQLMMKLIDEEG